MGIVYLAIHRGLNRRVALKLLRESAQEPAAQVARFRREAEAAARCQHPNLVQIHDFGEYEGELFIALEYVAGGHLGHALAGEPQPPRQAAELVETLARAIDHAHAQGIVHRDLKPANILLTVDGQPKITDFGLAKLKDSTTRTEEGTVLGTLAYMAPEQAEASSSEIGARTDIHALGAILYEAITGRPPYRAESPQQFLHAILVGEVVPPSQRQAGIPRDLEAICLKCLEKRPNDRYANAADFAEDLRRFLDGQPTLARPVPPTARLWRWCRRNPKLAAISTALAATVLVATSAFVATTYRHNAQLRGEVQRTAASEAKARRNYQEARSAIQAMLARFKDQRFAGTPRMKELLGEQMDDARAFYDGILSQLDTHDPAVEEDAARALGLLSTYEFELGHPDQAKEHVNRALDLIEKLRSADHDNRSYLGLQVECLNRLTVYLGGLGRTDDAIAAGAKAVSAAETLAHAMPEDLSAKEMLAMCHDTQALCLRGANQLDAALSHYQEAIKIRDGLDPARMPDLAARSAGTRMNEASLLWNVGRFPEANDRFGQVERLFQELRPEKRNNAATSCPSTCGSCGDWSTRPNARPPGTTPTSRS
jgi:tetratricopeptide (TPR) repeat protein